MYSATELVLELDRQGLLRGAWREELSTLAAALDALRDGHPERTEARYERALCRFFERLAEAAARGYPRMPQI